jgi:hypothetical protein
MAFPMVAFDQHEQNGIASCMRRWRARTPRIVT